MILALTIVSVVLIAIFFAVLVIGVVLIAGALEQIGVGRSGYSGQLGDLGRIAFGVRAIEQQTSHLESELARLNRSLSRAAEGLDHVDRTLAETVEALHRQRRGA